MLNTQGVVVDGFKTTCKNKIAVLYLTLIMLPLMVSISLIVDILLVDPMREALASPPSDLESNEEFQYLVSFLVWFLAAFGVLVLMEILGTAYSAATLAELSSATTKEKMRWMAKAWQRVSFTWFLILLYSIAYLVGGSGAIYIVVKACREVVIVAAFAVISKLVYICLATLWIVALVISNNGDECYGLDSIHKARDLITQKKHHALAMMLVFLPPLFANVAVLRVMFAGIEPSEPVWYAFVVVMASVVCPSVLFLFDVCAVFCIDSVPIDVRTDSNIPVSK